MVQTHAVSLRGLHIPGILSQQKLTLKKRAREKTDR